MIPGRLACRADCWIRLEAQARRRHFGSVNGAVSVALGVASSPQSTAGEGSDGSTLAGRPGQAGLEAVERVASRRKRQRAFGVSASLACSQRRRLTAPAMTAAVATIATRIITQPTTTPAQKALSPPLGLSSS